jgi:hypothetical protein
MLPSDRRRVFVLGAGFSYAAGFPLANALLPETHDLLPSADQALLLKAIRYVYPQPKTAAPSKILGSVGVEEFMSLLDMSERFNERLPNTSLRRPQIRELRAKLIRAIADLMLRRQDAAETNDLVGYVDAFIRKLDSSDTVITFNWDVLLERRLNYVRRSYTHHSLEGARPRLTVLKLHGSIDWFHGEQLERLNEAYVVHRQLFRLPYFRLIDPSAAWRQNAVPFVVPPTFFKNVQGTTDLEDMWAVAFQRLQEATEIHFCGYRLPREDMYARAVLRRAIRSNALRCEATGQPVPRITVVNPQRQVTADFKLMLYDRITGQYQKFQDSRWAR